VADSHVSYDRMPPALAIVLGLFAVGGIVAARWSPPPSNPSAARADLSRAELVEVRDATGRPVLSGEFRERTDAQGNPKRDAALNDRRGRRVIGEIEIVLPGPQSMTNAPVLEVDVIELDANAKYSVYIDDREVASFTADDRGSIDTELEVVAGEQLPR
jgi:hypothetical protein